MRGICVSLFVIARVCALVCARKNKKTAIGPSALKPVIKARVTMHRHLHTVRTHTHTRVGIQIRTMRFLLQISPCCSHPRCNPHPLCCLPHCNVMKHKNACTLAHTHTHARTDPCTHTSRMHVCPCLRTDAHTHMRMRAHTPAPLACRWWLCLAACQQSLGGCQGEAEQL